MPWPVMPEAVQESSDTYMSEWMKEGVAANFKAFHALLKTQTFYRILFFSKSSLNSHRLKLQYVKEEYMTKRPAGISAFTASSVPASQIIPGGSQYRPE